MALDREAIYAALFNRLEALGLFTTISRQWRHWDDVTPSEQPALFLAQGNETPNQERGMPPSWRLFPTVFLYARNDQPGDRPNMNALVRAVEGALERTANEYDPFGGPEEWGTTLGGRCSHCRISGTIETDQGVLGGQAVSVIPLEVLATS